MQKGPGPAQISEVQRSFDMSKSSIVSEPSIARASFHTLDVDGLQVFYREAGPADAPVVLLLHGFAASSHMFRELIPRLAGRYRVIAPDLPGFGFTVVPAERGYKNSFDSLAKTIGAFVEAVKLEKYAIYVFDYGAPVGFRLAVANPERITGIVSQNGNAFEEGLSDGWNPIQRYWQQPTKENREALRDFLTPESIRWQYTHGVKDPSTVAPEAYTLDSALLARPGQTDIQLDLFLDYASNLKLYPTFQKFLREKKPPVLAVWGKNDPFFLPPGAEAFKRENPNATVKFFDTGHFALETHVEEIAASILEFLDSLD
jgi:pimeloyl-ACP methyl ester carboxylesterase